MCFEKRTKSDLLRLIHRVGALTEEVKGHPQLFSQDFGTGSKALAEELKVRPEKI